jgi:hypothetical protein
MDQSKLVVFALGIALQIGLAWWLLMLAERSSPIARRAFRWVFGIWGGLLVFQSLIDMANRPGTDTTINLIGALAYVAGIAFAIRILAALKPALIRASQIRGAAPVHVTLKTEMPGFIATLLLLLIGLVQLAKDWNK